MEITPYPNKIPIKRLTIILTKKPSLFRPRGLYPFVMNYIALGIRHSYVNVLATRNIKIHSALRKKKVTEFRRC